MKHVIAIGPRYSESDPGDGSYPAAPLECACGWSGRLDAFAQHRKDMGEKKGEGHRNRRTRPDTWRGTMTGRR